MADILILYYSVHESTKKMARFIARGVGVVKGANATLRTVSNNGKQDNDSDPLVDINDIKPTFVEGRSYDIPVGNLVLELKDPTLKIMRDAGMSMESVDLSEDENVNENKMDSFKQLGMDADLETEHAISRSSVVIDCTPSGIGHKNKEKQSKDKNDNVVDADFEEVKEDKTKDKEKSA